MPAVGYAGVDMGFQVVDKNRLAACLQSKALGSQPKMTAPKSKMMFNRATLNAGAVAAQP